MARIVDAASSADRGSEQVALFVPCGACDSCGQRMDLLERSTELAALEVALADVCSSGRGSLVLVAGEAGIGKTALLDAFCDGNGNVPTLRGGCDALFTPRPLGPVLEIAAELDADGETPHELVQAMARGLRERGSTVIVMEDLHWADEATLDVVRP
jgi:predicted ATPase